jgi:Mg/Co/Ni transporter MgtE
MRDLLIFPPETPITEIMTENVKTVSVSDEPVDVLELIAKYNLIAVPVLDEEEKMAGIVMVDDILEQFIPGVLKRKRHT